MSTSAPKSGTTVVVGNPKAQSRTRSVAEAFAAGLIMRGDAARAAPYQVIEVAELSAGLFDWGSAPVRAAVDAVRASRIVVVASRSCGDGGDNALPP